jgi:predicted ATPase
MVKSLFAGNRIVQASSLSVAELNNRLPESLHATLQARLDSLSPEARAVVLLASVIGRVFWVGAVEAAALQSAGPSLLRGSATDIERLMRAALPEIVQAELAFPRAGSVFTGEQEYIFKHSILRDVAYGLLPHKYLRQYHLAVARWLAARTGPDLSATVAAHLEVAGENREAARCYLAAGDYAAAHGAADEAEWLRTRARKIADRPATAGPITTEPLRGTGLFGPGSRR